MIPAIVVLMMLGLTTAVSSPSVAAQTRPPLAPKSLLTELDHFSKGYRDVISESHASAIENIIRTYRYDGSRYQLQKCVSRSFFDNSGKQTNLPLERPCEEKPKLQ